MSSYQQSYSDEKINNIKQQIDVTKTIMKDNIDKVIDRGHAIDDLVYKAEILDQNALKFKRESTNLRKKIWCDNFKTTLLIVAVILIILAVLTIVVYSYTK